MQFDPFWIFRSPLSGDVIQRFNSPWFSPNYTFNYAGDAAIEGRVVSDVASYGKQIGWLNEVVLALAQNAELTEETSKTLRKIVDASEKIQRIKEANKKDTLAAAIDALDRLKQDQPTAYYGLMQERTQQIR
jgi:ABC-type nitrate/sulfonate/bicarbonate transport system substrate-binding protein